MTALILFGSVVVMVFLLGFQSINVNRGQYGLAAITSLGIGICNLALFKIVPNVEASLDILAYLVGGPVGIITAMLIHEWFSRKKRG